MLLFNHDVQLLTGSLALLVGLAVAHPAGATLNDASNFQAHPTAAYVQVGLGTPLGWGGVEIEQTVASFLALSGGVGMGFSGPQVAVMPRLRFGGRDGALTFGAGASYGRFVWTDGCLLHCTPARAEGVALWDNLEVGIEIRRSSGFSFRAFIGHGNVVGRSLVCTVAGNFGCDLDAASKLFYLGVAVGWAF